MKKRKIFDIEKIGFGDEEVVATPKSVSINEVKQRVNTVRQSEVKPVIDRPQAILSQEIKVVQEKKPMPSTTRTGEGQTGAPKTAIYKPVEFVSPITGRRVQQPKAVQLAHGKYQLSTATIVTDEGQEAKRALRAD